MNVHGSGIHNNFKLKTTCVHISALEWVNKLWLYSGLSYSFENIHPIVTQSNVDECYKYNVD